MLASELIDGARLTLIDSAKVTWSDAELLGYLNEALRATAFGKPDMYTIRGFVSLVSGESQQIPAAGIALMDIDRNSDANGGRIVTQVDKSLLAECSRFWPAGTKQARVEHFTADPREPRRFRVYPPNNGAGSVDMLYGAVPTALTSVSDTIPVADTYQAALTAYVLSRAYAKNSKRQDLTKTSSYQGQWGQLLGLKSKAQVATSPRVTEVPGT